MSNYLTLMSFKVKTYCCNFQWKTGQIFPSLNCCCKSWVATPRLSMHAFLEPAIPSYTKVHFSNQGKNATHSVAFLLGILKLKMHSSKSWNSMCICAFTYDCHFCWFLSCLKNSFSRYFTSIFSGHVNVKILQYNCSLVGMRNLDHFVKEKKIITNYRTIKLSIVF